MESPYAFDFDAVDVAIGGVGVDGVFVIRFGDRHRSNHLVDLGMEERNIERGGVGVVVSANFPGEEFLRFK